jgi:glyoxylate reductase
MLFRVPPKVFASRRFPDPVRAALEQDFELDVHDSEWPPERDELLRRVAGCDGLMAMLTDRIDDELIDAAGPQLRIVANYAVGYDNVDLEAVTRRGVLVSNTRDVLTDTVAELTLALLLALARRIAEGDRLIRTRQGWIWAPNLMLGAGLAGKRLGLVGYGRIATAVEKRAAAFGMEIVHSSRRGGLPLEELLATSDVVSLHVPLSEETHHLIGEHALHLMRPTAFLVNTTRGPVVDEAALLRALEKGEIAGGARRVRARTGGDGRPARARQRRADAAPRLRHARDARGDGNAVRRCATGGPARAPDPRERAESGGMARLAAVALAAAFAAVPASAGKSSSIALARLVTPSFGVVVGPQAVYTWSSGHWRDVSPSRRPVWDAQFLDRRHGFVYTGECGAGPFALYATGDSGRTWRVSHPRVFVGCHAGAGVTIDFVTPRRGWLTHVEPTGPFDELLRTSDGGVTWKALTHELPVFGLVRFTTKDDGWLGQSDYCCRPRLLYATSDGGRTWHARRVPQPPRPPHARSFPNTPVFFGRRGVLSSTVFTPRRSDVAFFTSADGGRTWAFVSFRRVQFRTLRRDDPFPRYVAVAVASPRVWWVVSALAHPRVQVTVDGGRHWRAANPPPTAPRAAWAEIGAAGRASAWLTLHPRDGAGVLFATSDGGRTWRRLLPR